MDNQNVMSNPATEFLEWARRDKEPKSSFGYIAPYEDDDLDFDHDDFGEADELEAFFLINL